MPDTETTKSLGMMTELELDAAMIRLVEARAVSAPPRARILGQILDRVLDEKLRRREHV